jgi:hypothetical protein
MLELLQLLSVKVLASSIRGNIFVATALHLETMTLFRSSFGFGSMLVVCKARPVVPFADHQTERRPQIIVGDGERGLGSLAE